MRKPPRRKHYRLPGHSPLRSEVDVSEMGVSGEGKRKREGGEVEVREGEGREKKRRMG
jgi:hypothetical protein